MERKMEHVKEILGGFAVLIGVLAILGMTLAINQINSQKVQNMTRLCISEGYEGWDDDGRGSGCVK